MINEALHKLIVYLLIGFAVYFVLGVVRWLYVGGEIEEYVKTFFVEWFTFMLIVCLLNIAIVIVKVFKRRWLDGRE
jgi:hypothetical protein